MGTTCNLVRWSLWHSSMFSKNQRDCSRLSSNTKLEFRFFDGRFEATWMHHSAAHRWSYPGTTSQNSDSLTTIYVYFFSLVLKAVTNSRAAWENLLRRIGQVVKPLQPNHRVHVSIILWLIRRKVGDDGCAIRVVHRVGKGFNLLPDQSETTCPFHCWESSLLSFEAAVKRRTTWISLPSLRVCLDCPEALQVGSRTWCLFLHGCLSIVCPDSNALWINVVYWNWCLMRPSVLKNELNKFDAAALGCRLAEQLRWWRCSFIRTS